MHATVDVLDDFLNLDESIPTLDDTPLLADLVEHSRSAGTVLDRFDALFVQHQLVDQVAMARALVELGLPPERITWIDVPYTSHDVTRRALTDHVGIAADRFDVCDDFQVTRPYAAYQRRRVQAFVREWLDSDPRARRPLLVLDDGAHVLDALAAYRIDEVDDVRIVEQTSRGFKKINARLDLALLARNVPVVDVARSWVKKRIESPFIGLSIVAALRRALARLGASGPNRALVLGYGSVGTEVARFLASEYPAATVFVWDPDPAKVRTAIQAGHRAHASHGAGSGPNDLVVGCSGQASFRTSDWPLIAPGGTAALVSGSSGTVELSRRDFIELAESEPDDSIALSTDALDERDVHADLHFDLPQDRRATFVNAGFPLNFDGRARCIPIRLIEPTMAMMVQGALQAAGLPGGATGAVELDAGFCDRLARGFVATARADHLALVVGATPTRRS
ncbi:MAG: hypothetical protein S0880_07285 [Actinomycetota bacterium]|nr:hypothetical protein [Actinomycetota bacterium]